MRSSNSGIDHRRATLMGVSLPSRHGALPQAPCMRKPWRVALDCPRAYEGRRRARSDMRRCFALISLLAALSSFPLLADDPLPPQHTFGPDTTRTGFFTGTGPARWAAASVRHARAEPSTYPVDRTDRSLDRPARRAAAERRCDELDRRAGVLQAELPGRALPRWIAPRSRSPVPELPRLPLHLERVHSRDGAEQSADGRRADRRRDRGVSLHLVAGQILPDGEGQREERRGAAPGLRAAGVHGRPLSLARGVAHVPRPAEDRSRVPDRRILRRYRAPARGEQVRRSRLRARSRLRLARCPPEKQRNSVI